MLSPQYKSKYTLIPLYEPTNADAMIQADRHRSGYVFNTCMYMHSSNTTQMHTGTHSTHAEPIWMESERANMNETQFSSYAAHVYDPSVLACRPSKHVPSL
jgi:hypothetical protein